MTVHSFSTGTATTQTPATKRRRPSTQNNEEATEVTPAQDDRNEQQPLVRIQRGNPNRTDNTTNLMAVENVEGIVRTLYDTPAPRREVPDEELIDKFINMDDRTVDSSVEKQMLLQVTNSARKLVPNDPKGSRSKARVQVR